MKPNQTSMELIPEAMNTVVISSECGHGLRNESETKNKRCPKCGRVLPVTDFYGNKKSKDGLQDKCKECQQEQQREYQQRKKEERRLASLNHEDKVEVEKVIVDSKERTMAKVYNNPELAKFTPRELMSELKARGYRWEYMLEPQRRIMYDKI